MLREDLAIIARLGIDHAPVTCDETNAASAAVVEHGGGVLQDVVPDGAARVRRHLVRTIGAA